VQAPQVRAALFRRAHVGLGDDLHQGDGAPVEIRERRLGAGELPFVDKLPGILLHVDPRDPDPLRAAVDLDVDVAAEGDRQLVLRDLVRLGEVRVEVVLRAKTLLRCTAQEVASAVRIVNSTALRLSTGSTPGMPVHTGQVFSLGAAPNAVEQAQKILLFVESWAWTSSR